MAYVLPSLTDFFVYQQTRIQRTLNARRIDCPETLPLRAKSVVFPPRPQARQQVARILTADQMADMQRLRQQGCSIKSIAQRFHVWLGTARAVVGGQETYTRTLRRTYVSRPTGATHEAV